MTALVTGGAGYIGSHMLWELIDHGIEAVALDNLATGFDWLVPQGVKLVVGNAGDSELVEQLIREHDIDVIFHFAGSVVVPESIADPLKYYANNTGVSRNLIAAAVNTGVDKFIFSSSAAVYGEPVNGGPIREDALLAPMSPYGSSKLMTEIMLRDAAIAHGIRYVMLRYFNVAGGDPAGRTGQSTRNATHLIKIACEAALGKREHIEVYGTDYKTADGSGVRDYIHVSDLVNAHYLAYRHLIDGGQKFTANCGYCAGNSVLEVIESVKRVSGVNFTVKLGQRRAGDVSSLVADASRLTSRLNWQPRFADIDTIVAHALAWEQKRDAVEIAR